MTANLTEVWTLSLTASSLAYFFVTTVCALLAMFGNLLVIQAIRRHSRLQTITNQYLTSLACTDLVVGGLAVYYSIFNILPALNMSKPFCFSRMIQIIPSFTSVYHLMAIAVDRYLAIIHPLRYYDLATPKRTKFIIVSLWSCGSLLFIITLSTSKPWNNADICSLYVIGNDIVLIFAFTAQFFLIFFIMSILYGKIFLVARRQAAKVSIIQVTNQSKPSRPQRISLRRELKAAKMLAVVIGFFVICYSGIFTVITVAAFGFVRPNLMMYYKISLFMVFFNSLMNPVVYAGTNKYFRAAFYKILCRFRKRQVEEDTVVEDMSFTAISE